MLISFLQASGSLGTPVLEEIVKSGKFNVTVVQRSGSSSTYPEHVTVKTADFDSVESLTAAFKGQEAVVSTVGAPGLAGQPLHVKAAVAAGVKRYLPSDFGSDLANPKTAVMPPFGFKTATHKALREAAEANPEFTYSNVSNGAFLDWGLEHAVLINWKDTKPKLFDGGKAVFSATTLESVGKAVVGVLSHPEETKNRFVYVKSADISQLQLLKLAKKIDPERKWEEPTYIDTAEQEKQSYENLAKGDHSLPVMYSFLFRVIYGPPEYGSQFPKVDNELLGVPFKTEAEIEALLKKLIDGAK